MKKSLRWHIAQFLEIRWWKNYLSNKDVTTYLEWKIKYWKQLLSELSELKIPENANILDAGCGPAGVFIALSQYRVKAIDPLLDEYKNLAHYQPERFKNVNFQTQTIEGMDNQSFYDVIFCLNAINHVSNIELAYDNLCNNIKENGYLVISIDAHNSNFLKRIFKALPGDALHPHQYNLKEYENFLTSRGFKIRQTLLKEKGNIFNYYVQVAQKLG
ncbi:MAG: class I SAM-dependent methyltransferase [Chitinophagales bacterium]|nr:class I SAM-dependent methyltransferase [Chitinophagales bacterium]